MTYIEYIEEFLGLSEGFLSNSDFGLMICFVLMAVVIFATFKVFWTWMERLFNR